MDIIYVPLGFLLKLFNNLLGNQYILALLVFAVIVEIVLLPFSIKQQKNSIRQARLKPKEMAIRKKYAGRDDRQTQQEMSQEIQEMYQKENYNPMAGCLPLLIQLPVILALYNIVMNPLKYICGLSENAISQIMTIIKSFPEYAEKVTSLKIVETRNVGLLSIMEELMETHGASVFSGVEGFSEVKELPNLVVFGAIDLGEIPNFTNFTWVLLVPFLTFVVYFFSMRLSRKFTYQAALAEQQAGGCSPKMMDYVMPLMSVFISFSVPAAIGVYWIFKSILSTLKQFILHKAMPLPKFTEEDYKAAEREVGVRGKGKSKVNHAVKTALEEANTPAVKSKHAGAVRSLHHIDDEDFEDTRERAERAKAAKEALDAEKQAQAREKGGKISLDGATVKKDDLPPEGKKKAAKKKTADAPEKSDDAPSHNQENNN